MSTRNSLGHPTGPAGQQHDPVAEAGRLADVVRHEQDRAAGLLPDPLQLVVQDVAGHRVQRTERLVHEQDLRVAGERTRQGGTLAHPSRQLVWLATREGRELDQLEELGDTLTPLPGGDPSKLERQLHVALDGQPREQGRLLEHEGWIARAMDGPGGRRVEARDQVEQRGLAAAGGPEDRHELAFTDGQRDVLECGDGPAARREHLRDGVDLDGDPPCSLAGTAATAIASRRRSGARVRITAR